MKRALFCIILLTAGCGRHSSSASRSGPRALPSPPESPARFTDITRQAGITFRHQASRTPRKYLPETMSGGCAFLDYNGDGRLDLLLLNGRLLPGGKATGRTTPALYRNDGGLRFTDVTREAGLGREEMYAMGVAVGDYDNDGREDFYVSCVLGPGKLFHNLGARFEEVAARAGVTNDAGFGSSCAWLDYDRDGLLDLFICNYVKYRSLQDDLPCFAGGGRDRIYCVPTAYENVTCRLFRNAGGGRFQDVSRQTGIGAATGKSLGVSVWDYDDDGDPDIFVANDTVAGFLFKNEGNGRFSEIGVEAGVALDEEGNPHSGMGIETGDLMNNGRPWMLLTNFQGQNTSAYTLAAQDVFRDDRFPTGIAEVTESVLGFGILFLDYDNDGWQDVAQVNGHVQDDIAKREAGVTHAQPTLLLRNRGNGTFSEVGLKSGAPFNVPMVGRSIAAGDVDNDGKVDLLMLPNDEPARLWRNETEAGSWVGFRLVGGRSNRSGIGAVLRLKAAGVTQTKAVRSGSSYLSASDLRVHFGLGGAAGGNLEVRWPSGAVDRIGGVRAGHYWTVREGAGALEADAP